MNSNEGWTYIQGQAGQCVVFVASLISYDLCLMESRDRIVRHEPTCMCPSVAKLTTSQSHQNAMMHQLDRFDVIINSEWIASTASVHLLFTKWDVFEEKIKRRPISDYCIDYTGGDDPQKGLEYFTRGFAQRNRLGKKVSFQHADATDSQQMEAFLSTWEEAAQRDAQDQSADG